MFLKQCKWLISISRMKFYADINKDNSSNPRVLFFVHLCLWLQNEQRQFCEEFAPHPGGTNDNDAHSCEPNYIKVQNKIIAKILPVNKFTTPKFLLLLRSMNGYFFLHYYVLLCNTCLYRSVHRHGHHCRSSPPGWGAHSSQSCRSCSFSGHIQRCWTFLSELRHKEAYNPNTFFLNWKQRTAGKAVEDALNQNCQGIS